MVLGIDRATITCDMGCPAERAHLAAAGLLRRDPRLRVNDPSDAVQGPPAHDGRKRISKTGELGFPIVWSFRRGLLVCGRSAT